MLLSKDLKNPQIIEPVRFNPFITVFCVMASQGRQTNLSNNDIEGYVWKCGEPCGLSDVLIFDKNTQLRGDTIFHNSTPYGKIVKRTSNFGADTKIAVVNLSNLKTTDTCVYHAK